MNYNLVYGIGVAVVPLNSRCREPMQKAGKNLTQDVLKSGGLFEKTIKYLSIKYNNH
jgi:hypothetical protein